MIFFERSDDLIISSPNRSDILALLKLRFNCINRNITLRCYAVTNPEMVTLIKTNDSNSKQAGIYDLPDDSQRLRNEEVKGEEEYKEELRWKKGTVEDAPFEFDRSSGFEGQEPVFPDKNKGFGIEEELTEFSDLRKSVLIGQRTGEP